MRNKPYQYTQEELQREYENPNQYEWTEQPKGMPPATLRSSILYEWGVAKLQCVTCGKEFYCNARSYHSGAKHCSDQCKKVQYTERRRAYNRAISCRATRCIMCGAKLKGRRSDAIYCSAACKQQSYRRKKEVTQYESNL